jgi:predicted glycosyltransferase involved in capsule biosynthesis
MACKKERVFENTSVVADVKSKKILSIKVIDEHVHDSKALPELVNNVMKIDSIPIISFSICTLTLLKIFSLYFRNLWLAHLC